MGKQILKVLTAITLLLMASGLVMSALSCGVMEDSNLQTSIKEELRKHNDIGHDNLTVNVRDGIVTISGELGTQEEIDKVMLIVSAMEGVVEVKDQMNIPDNFNATNPTMLWY